jgi:hypothetical protein
MAKDFAGANLLEKTLTNISDCGYKLCSWITAGKIGLFCGDFPGIGKRKR